MTDKHTATPWKASEPDEFRERGWTLSAEYLQGKRLDYWPSRNKFQHNGKVMVGDVEGYIKKERRSKMQIVTGREFKAMLAESGLRSKDILKESGVSSSALSLFINGKTMPSLSVYTRLMNAYEKLTSSTNYLRQALIAWLHDNNKTREWLAPQVKATPAEITSWLLKNLPAKPTRRQAQLLEEVTLGEIKASKIDRRY